MLEQTIVGRIRSKQAARAPRGASGIASRGEWYAGGNQERSCFLSCAAARGRVLLVLALSACCWEGTRLVYHLFSLLKLKEASTAARLV